MLGLLRLIVALLAITKLRKSSIEVHDAELIGTLAIVQARLGVNRTIKLSETTETNAALTFGWVRPVILISTDWKAWNQQQLEATLAHELAHIANGDFLQRLIAQSASVLHFYNPLVHYLCHQLRMEQELAADDRAAEIIGGRKNYLQALAEMALANDYPNGRLAPMFLPTRKTFFRRIEMLRTPEGLKKQTSKWSGWIGVGFVILVGVAIASLRLPTTAMADGLPAATATAQSSTTVVPDEAARLSFVDEDADLVLVTRPARLLDNALVKKIDSEITKPENRSAQTISGTRFNQITDGTSNTILLVEAKRNTHWAKPEDIPFQLGKNAKEFGGFHPDKFNVAIADGSVHWVDESIAAETLNYMLQKADGNMVTWGPWSQ